MKANNKKNNKPPQNDNFSDDEGKVPKDAIEITDNEDYDYEIITSHDNVNPKQGNAQHSTKPLHKETANPYKKSKIGISKEEEKEKMGKKINEQAKRLIDLHSYKILCEKRIRQLVPNHPIPVTEEDLKSEMKELSGSSGLIKMKDREIAELKKKITELESKIQNRNQVPVKISTEGEVTKDMYANLVEAYQNILIEKEHILDSLRNETLTNEEQRNYIEILKQTIESSIVKNGLGPFLQSNKSQFPTCTNASNVDILVDIAKIKSDADNYRKELVMAQVLISELKQEVEFLKKQNEDLSILNERIKENYEKTCSDLDDANKRASVLQEEKENLISNLEDVNQQHKNAKETADESRLKIRKYEKDILENSRKINELSNNLENHEAVQKDLSDYKKNFDRLYADYEKLLKEKSGLETDIQQVKDENAFRLQEEKRLKQFVEDKEERYEKDKRNWMNENENLSKTCRKTERSNIDLTTLLKEKESDLLKLEGKLSELNNNYMSLKEKSEQEKNLFEDYRNQAERKIILSEQSIKECQNTLRELRGMNESLSRDKEKLQCDFSEHKREYEKLDQILKATVKEKDAKERSLSLLNEQYEKLYNDLQIVSDERNSLKNDKDSLCKELRYWKDKYDKDIAFKQNEIMTLTREIESQMNKCQEFTDEIRGLKDEAVIKDTQLQKLDDNKDALTSELRKIKSENQELEKKISHMNSELQAEVNNGYELSNMNNSLTLKLQEMAYTLDNIKEEKVKSDYSRQRLSAENSSHKKLLKENQIKIHSVNSNIQESTHSAQTCESVISSFIPKFKSIIENNNNNSKDSQFYSVNFAEFLNLPQPTASSSLIEYLKHIEKFIRIACVEFEIWYDNLKSYEHENSQLTARIKNSEDDFQTVVMKLEESEANNQTKEKILNQLTEELEMMKNDRIEYESESEKIFNELKCKSLENKNLLSDLNYMKEDFRKIKDTSELLKRDINEKHDLLVNASFQVDALEERIIILSKEKKQLEEVLTRVSRSFPNSEMSRLVNDILSIKDNISQLERDKIKYRNSYAELETQTSQDKQCDSALRMEQSKLIEVASDIDKRINDKLIEQKALEDEISKIEMNERRAGEDLYQYDYKNKQLAKQLNDTQDELRRVKSRFFSGDSELCSDESKNMRNASSSLYRRNKNIPPCESFQFSNDGTTTLKMDNAETFPSQDSFQNTRDFSGSAQIYKRHLQGNS